MLQPEWRDEEIKRLESDLLGKWETVFDYDEQSIEVIVVFSKNSKLELTYDMGDDKKIITTKYTIGSKRHIDGSLEAREIDAGHEGSVEEYRGGKLKKTKPLGGNGSDGIYSFVSIENGCDGRQNHVLHFPLPVSPPKGTNEEDRLLEVDEFFQYTRLPEQDEKKEKNSIVDALASIGPASVLKLAGVEHDENLCFKESGTESVVYRFSRDELSIYSEGEKYNKAGSTLERVKRVFWIYRFFHQDEYNRIYPLDHWRDREEIEARYSAEEKELDDDAGLLTYWLFHFGLLRDRRYGALKDKATASKGKRLVDVVALIDAVINQSDTVQRLHKTTLNSYTEFVYKAGFRLGVSPSLYSYIHGKRNLRTKAYWIVKNAQELDEWEGVHQALLRVEETKQGYAYIQANNPLLPSKERRRFAAEHLVEMERYFDEYSNDLDSFNYIYNIYQKIDDLGLLKEVCVLYFRKLLERYHAGELIACYNEIVDYLRQNEIEGTKYAPVEEALLEKFDSVGYKQIKFVRYREGIIAFFRLNGGGGEEAKRVFSKASAEKMGKEALDREIRRLYDDWIQKHLDKGFVRVARAGELAESTPEEERARVTAKRMDYRAFEENYPDIFLDSVWWKNWNIEVYEEDASFEETINLNDSDLFVSGKLFLKDLSVEGDIVNFVAENGAPIQVEGSTTAHSIIAGGAHVKLNRVEVRDLVAVFCNDGIMEINGELKARVVLDDNDHCCGFPESEKADYHFIEDEEVYFCRGKEGVYGYSALAEKFSEERWVEEEGETLRTSARQIVNEVRDFKGFCDEIEKRL